ncbi:MAG: UvrD-helicase domain-containing protein [Desulfobaccales bacterium]
MEIIADFHIHSRYSIATGQQADLEHLDLWGRYKGVTVVGTGDCTHPEWLKELSAKLIPAEEGVLRLKPELVLPLQIAGPLWETVQPVRFVVTGEVSAIYSKGGRVRKVHLLLILSGLEAAKRLSQSLGRLGNITADGRPILGLDARHILELTLEADPEALVIPAHIWTPWFSVLGAKSGFDSLEECFEEHLGHIYALETGLSSDPAMNWRVSGLDRFLLVSNSDAHSPQKLAREANLFSVPPAYPDIARALRTRNGFAGTIEFFPEEGKYHLDGHRKCGLRLTPEEAAALGGICPACHKPLTLGVMHRVLDLADRPAGLPAPGSKPYESLISLVAVLGEVLECRAGGKKIERQYFRLLEKLGPELVILRQTPEADLAREGGELLAYAVAKMRRGEVHIAPGYDGLYGEIALLTPEERRRGPGQGALWRAAAPRSQAEKPLSPAPDACRPSDRADTAAGLRAAAEEGNPLQVGLNEAQWLVVTHQGGPLIVQAGPGTGKTRALTHRLVYLLKCRQAPPETILALTFTRRAAEEMTNRVKALLPGFPGLERLTVGTFHALGLKLLSERGLLREVADEDRRLSLLKAVAAEWRLPLTRLDWQISAAKQALQTPGDVPPKDDPLFAQAFAAYETLLAQEGLWDYEDLLVQPLRLLENDQEVRRAYQERFRYLLVDEYQDLNEAQYRLFRILAGPAADILVIGDPHQAIYGFRGAKPEYFRRFQEDWPNAMTVTFTETYRLPPPLLTASRRLLPEAASPRVSRRQGDLPVVLLEAASPEAEALAVARRIEALVGGLDSQSLEDDRLRYQEPAGEVGFGDIAVLFRLHAQGPELLENLTAAGIPCELARPGVGPEVTGLDFKAQRVKLLTLHAAKGLEFQYVFLTGCEAGLLPLEPEGREPADPEEERRLFYVGLTRAQCQVFLTRARRRTLWGKPRQTRLSPFAETVDPVRLSSGSGKTRSQTQKTLFPELRRQSPKRGRRRSRGTVSPPSSEKPSL